MLCLKVCTAQTEWLAEWHATEQLFGFLSLTHTHLVKTDGHLNEDLLCFHLGIPTDYEMVFWVVGTSHVGLQTSSGAETSIC